MDDGRRRRTDNGAYLYYKLTYEPKGSGELTRIYPPELQLSKANTYNTQAPCLVLHLSVSDGFVSSKIYDKRDD